MTTIDGPALLLRIYIGETDQWHGQPLYHAIVQHARKVGLAGATVLRGLESYGANNHLHTTRILSLSEDLPIVIDIVDRTDRLREALPALEEMVGDGLVTLTPVEVVAYRGSRRA